MPIAFSSCSIIKAIWVIANEYGLERRNVQLPFAETLPGSPRSEKIASDLRDRKDITRVDFAFVFLSKPGPVAATFPASVAQNLFRFLDRGDIRWPAHSDVRGFP